MDGREATHLMSNQWMEKHWGGGAVLCLENYSLLIWQSGECMLQKDNLQLISSSRTPRTSSFFNDVDIMAQSQMNFGFVQKWTDLHISNIFGCKADYEKLRLEPFSSGWRNNSLTLVSDKLKRAGQGSYELNAPARRLVGYWMKRHSCITFC